MFPPQKKGGEGQRGEKRARPQNDPPESVTAACRDALNAAEAAKKHATHITFFKTKPLCELLVAMTPAKQVSNKKF